MDIKYIKHYWFSFRGLGIIFFIDGFMYLRVSVCGRLLWWKSLESGMYLEKELCNILEPSVLDYCKNIVFTNKKPALIQP